MIQGCCFGPEGLALVARYHGVSADADQIRHEAGLNQPMFSPADLIRSAKQLGLKSRCVNTTVNRFKNLPLPAIAKHVEGHYVIVARVDDNELLIHDLNEGAPKKISLADAIELLTGEVILVAMKGRFSVFDKQQRFSLSWFVPAIVKHKKLLYEVLLASLFIQLFALITPLFFSSND